MHTTSEPPDPSQAPAASLLRDRERDDGAKVGMVELFFDLVFVFAVTQVSHHLADHTSLVGTAQAGLLFAAVWWVWIYTSWATNFLDPNAKPVRLMLFALMLGGLLLAAALPDAFAEHGLAFAGAYVAMQLGRNAFLLWALRDADKALRRNFQRVMVWLALSSCFWIAGALAHGEMRFGLWVVALGLEVVSPIAMFWVPGMGGSKTQDWSVDGHHMAERCALFIIIALGEFLLMTGATFAESDWTPARISALVAAFVGAAAMWWIYFDSGADQAADRIGGSDDPGRLARAAYTYIHLPIVAGIIVSAVADELVLAHPDDANFAASVALLGGPALYLVGTAIFKWVTNDRPRPPLSHVAGLLLLALLAPIATIEGLPIVALCGASSGVLVVVAVWESLSLRRSSAAKPKRS